jgi:hypothetical protein
MGPILKTSVSVRTTKGRFPPQSVAVALLPARAALARDAARAFERRTDPVTGRRWAPRKHDYPHPPLVRTGKMRAEAITAARGSPARR